MCGNISMKNPFRKYGLYSTEMFELLRCEMTWIGIEMKRFFTVLPGKLYLGKRLSSMFVQGQESSVSSC